MSKLKWPYLAKDKDNNNVTPQQGKMLGGSFHILGIEVVPRCGDINRHHWAAKDDSISYDQLRPGFEMSEWHYDKQVRASEEGLQIEYKIETPTGVLFADAYDEKTNTIIEYVWSHYDDTKIEKYFDLGYNQIWEFAKDRQKQLKWEMKMAVKKCWNYRDTSFLPLDEIKNLPKVVAKWAS